MSDKRQANTQAMQTRAQTSNTNSSAVEDWIESLSPSAEDSSSIAASTSGATLESDSEVSLPENREEDQQLRHQPVNFTGPSTPVQAARTTLQFQVSPTDTSFSGGLVFDSPTHDRRLEDGSDDGTDLSSLSSEDEEDDSKTGTSLVKVSTQDLSDVLAAENEDEREEETESEADISKGSTSLIGVSCHGDSDSLVAISKPGNDEDYEILPSRRESGDSFATTDLSASAHHSTSEGPPSSLAQPTTPTHPVDASLLAALTPSPSPTTTLTSLFSTLSINPRPLDLTRPHFISITSCLQCVQLQLPCSRSLPACTRCVRKGNGATCLLQRRRLRAEQFNAAGEFDRTPVLLKVVGGESDEAWEGKLRARDAILKHHHAACDRANWVLPADNGVSGTYNKHRIVPPASLMPGEGVGRSTVVEVMLAYAVPRVVAREGEVAVGVKEKEADAKKWHGEGIRRP